MMIDPLYRDPQAAIDIRVDDLMGRMSDAEKVAQLTSVWVTLDAEGGDFAPYQNALPIPADTLARVVQAGVGSLTRPLGSRMVSPEKGVAAFNAFQKRQIETTRLGIPVLAHEEVLCGLSVQGATEFPNPTAWGATFEPSLIQDMADRIRRQSIAIGARMGLAPVADVITDQRWGRNEECVSEDPILVGAMVSAYVRGLQGEDWRTGVMATLKHFAGYSASAGGRNFGPSDMGERRLRERYLAPFERTVREARAAGIMNGYQEIDGIPCAANRWLLEEVLRQEWGFDGLVVADYFAVLMLHSLHGVAPDLGDSARKAITAGLDIELPSPHAFPHLAPTDRIMGGVREQVDRSVRRMLTWKIRLGLFEQPFVAEGPIVLDTENDRAHATTMARTSLTMLKNDGVLPLSADTSAAIAVIGPHAQDADASFGNYHFTRHVQAHFADSGEASRPTLVDAVRARLPKARIETCQGCPIVRATRMAPSLAMSPEGLVIMRENLVHDESGIAEAVALAARSDIVILALGDIAGHFRTGSSGEGTDTDDLSLPGAQAALARAILELSKPTILVLQNGRAFALGGAAEANAILVAWFSGAAAPDAIGDVLIGAADPGGRLPVTFPKTSGQQPRTYDARRLDAGVPRARDYAPAFAFGHGLSFTTFAVESAVLDNDIVVDGFPVTLRARIRNTGGRPGQTVLQLYAHDPIAETPRPRIELKGFQRVALEAGASCDVIFTLEPEVFALIGLDRRWIIEPGRIDLKLGFSSADIAWTSALEIGGERRNVAARRVWQAASRIA